MKQDLYNYDIFPKVFPVGSATEITVKPLGQHTKFDGSYRVVVQRLDAGSLGYDFAKWNHTDYDLTPGKEEDCFATLGESPKGIEVSAIRVEGEDKPIESLEDRLSGRFTINDVVNPTTGARLYQQRGFGPGRRPAAGTGLCDHSLPERYPH